MTKQDCKFEEKYSGGCWGQTNGHETNRHDPSCFEKYKMTNNLDTDLTEII